MKYGVCYSCGILFSKLPETIDMGDEIIFCASCFKKYLEYEKKQGWFK